MEDFLEKKIPETKAFQGFSKFEVFFEWCHQESNRGHKDFQSFALPTELWHHRFHYGCKGKRFFYISKLSVKINISFFTLASGQENLTA